MSSDLLVYMLFERLCLNSSIHGPLSLGSAPLAISLRLQKSSGSSLVRSVRCTRMGLPIGTYMKPQNILTDGVARLIDFGMARAICPSDTERRCF